MAPQVAPVAPVAPAPAPPVNLAATPPTAAPAPLRLRWEPFIPAGVAIVGLVVAITEGAWSKQCPTTGGTPQDVDNDTLCQLTHGVGADVGWGLAGAGAITAGVLWLVLKPAAPPSESTPRVSFTGNGVSLPSGSERAGRMRKGLIILGLLAGSACQLPTPKLQTCPQGQLLLSTGAGGSARRCPISRASWARQELRDLLERRDSSAPPDDRSYRFHRRGRSPDPRDSPGHRARRRDRVHGRDGSHRLRGHQRDWSHRCNRSDRHHGSHGIDRSDGRDGLRHRHPWSDRHDGSDRVHRRHRLHRNGLRRSDRIDRRVGNAPPDLCDRPVGDDHRERLGLSEPPRLRAHGCAVVCVRERLPVERDCVELRLARGRDVCLSARVREPIRDGHRVQRGIGGSGGMGRTDCAAVLGERADRRNSEGQ